MEELRETIQILQGIILIITFIIIFMIGVWLESKRPVELIYSNNGFAMKIKNGPPWLAIFTLIDFVIMTILFILFMLMR
jgi:hypothetical protein